MSRVRILVSVVLAQLVLVGLYRAVERSRKEPVPFRWEPLDEAVPSQILTRESRPVTTPDGPHLVHFWATWCVPCRRELPALIDAARDAGVPLLAVTDEPWPVVERFFDGDVPTVIVQDSEGLTADQWRVSTLPDTFSVTDGRVTARVSGERDWSSDSARRFLDGLR